MKDVRLPQSRVFMLLLAMLFLVAGCGKFDPPIEKEGKWYYGGHPLDSDIAWSETKGEFYRDRNHLKVERSSGYHTRLVCSEGLPVLLWREYYGGDGAPPAFDRVQYIAGKKHGLQSIRDLDGQEGYRVWRDGRELQADEVLRMWDQDAEEMGMSPEDLKIFKDWYRVAEAKADTRRDRRQWTRVLSGEANGNTWAASSTAEKTSLYEKLARENLHGNSANFYKDALNSFYDTDDASIKSVTINDLTRLIDASSTTLPANKRKY